MKLFDAHLDLAWNAHLGRDLRLELDELRRSDPVAGQTAGVTFPELRQAGLAGCFATLFACPASPEYPGGYTDPAGARRQALGQLDQYRRWQDAGELRLVGSRAGLARHLREWEPGQPPGVLLLMEGADPLAGPDDLPFWQGAGVGLIGLAWGRTGYAGGTNAPGPLTDRGRELLGAMRELGVAQDVSHLDDQSFPEALELQPLTVASHSNSRALVAGNRHFSDEMAKGIAERGGVIGLVGHSKFIRPGWEDGDPRATFGEWAAHARHYAALLGADLCGWEHVGLGSDLDGGFGSEKTPQGLERYPDLTGLLEELPAEVRPGVAGGHWQAWLEGNP